MEIRGIAAYNRHEQRIKSSVRQMGGTAMISRDVASLKYQERGQRSYRFRSVGVAKIQREAKPDLKGSHCLPTGAKQNQAGFFGVSTTPELLGIRVIDTR